MEHPMIPTGNQDCFQLVPGYPNRRRQMPQLHSSRTYRYTSAAPVSQNPGSACSSVSEIQTLSAPRNPLAE